MHNGESFTVKAFCETLVNVLRLKPGQEVSIARDKLNPDRVMVTVIRHNT